MTVSARQFATRDPGWKLCRVCELPQPTDVFPGRKGAVCNPCRSLLKKLRYRTDPEYRTKALADCYAWRTENPDKVRLAFRRNYENNPARVHKNSAAWKKRNPEKVRAQGAQRRARKRGAPLVERINRDYVYDRDGGRCHICLRAVDRNKFDLDHLVPLAHGGEHTHANLRVAHPFCNRSMGAARLPAQLLLVA
jgi:5-methylcytosine-specific restriction endonuclease McrA